MRKARHTACEAPHDEAPSVRSTWPSSQMIQAREFSLTSIPPPAATLWTPLTRKPTEKGTKPHFMQASDVPGSLNPMDATIYRLKKENRKLVGDG